MDDINLWGETSHCLEAFDFVDKELVRRGLRTNSKTTIYPPSLDCVPSSYREPRVVDGVVLPPRLTVALDGVKIVGTFRTRSEEARQAFLQKKITKDEVFFNRLSAMPPQHAFTLLQRSGVPRANYILRTHFADSTKNYAASFDNRSLDVLERAVL